ncbi:glycosyltransferase family 4 protein [Arthrospira platensis BEA 1257B]
MTLKSSSMHLIALENEPSSTLGGQELNLLEICQSLANRGHQVSLVYTKEGDLLQTYGQFCQDLIPVKRYQANRKNPFDMVKFAVDFFNDISPIKTTLDSMILSNEFSSVFWGYGLSTIKKIPLLSYLQLPGNSLRFKWRPGLSGVDKFIAVSQATKDRWVDFCGIDHQKIDVVYNGIDPPKFSPHSVDNHQQLSLRRDFKILGNRRVFSCLGRLNPNKGIEVLIKAFALLANHQPDICLLIAGNVILEPKKDSPEARINYLKFLKDMVDELGIKELVQFMGHVPNTPDLDRVSDVTIVPSISPDPCPRVVLESLSTGTPVVGSRVAGIPEMMTGELSRYLVEPGSPEQLAEVLNQVANWRDDDPELDQRCRDHVLDNFSPKVMIDQMEMVLLRTINQYYQH